MVSLYCNKRLKYKCNLMHLKASVLVSCLTRAIGQLLSLDCPCCSVISTLRGKILALPNSAFTNDNTGTILRII